VDVPSIVLVVILVLGVWACRFEYEYE